MNGLRTRTPRRSCPSLRSSVQRTSHPDSAAAYYRQVVDKHPTSPRAAAALYNLGLLAERRKDMAGARDAYQRVTQKYPQSDEAALARDRLKALGR